MPTNIELKKGRGADIMKQLIAEGSEPFDLFFIDADKQSYREYFELSLKLSLTQVRLLYLITSFVQVRS